MGPNDRCRTPAERQVQERRLSPDGFPSGYSASDEYAFRQGTNRLISSGMFSLADTRACLIVAQLDRGEAVDVSEFDR